jgi:4-hydroxybenzoate polyprenyltransferase
MSKTSTGGVEQSGDQQLRGRVPRHAAPSARAERGGRARRSQGAGGSAATESLRSISGHRPRDISHAEPEVLVRSESVPTIRDSQTRFPLFRMLRPEQWPKNVLVLMGAVFSGSGADIMVLERALLAMLSFTLAASVVYIANDLRDRSLDAAHPTRRRRPIASGQVSPVKATAVGVVLLSAALGTAWGVGELFTIIIGFYLLLNAVYSLGAKRVVIVDVIIVSMGFVLRAIAGAVAIKVAASSWIIVCTLTLALLVVLGKRRVDLEVATTNDLTHLLPAEWYSAQFLDLLMATSAGASIVTYSLYTLDPNTVARIGNRRLALTIPLAVYGCLRYLYLVHTGRANADPTSVLLRDRGLQVAAVGWSILALVAVYG